MSLQRSTNFLFVFVISVWNIALYLVWYKMKDTDMDVVTLGILADHQSQVCLKLGDNQPSL